MTKVVSTDSQGKQVIAAQPAGFIRQKKLLQEYVPFSAATLWRLVKTGKFPRPVRLASQVVAWRVADVQAWAKEPQIFGMKKKGRINLSIDLKCDPSNHPSDSSERSQK